MSTSGFLLAEAYVMKKHYKESMKKNNSISNGGESPAKEAGRGEEKSSYRNGNHKWLAGLRKKIHPTTKQISGDSSR
ncbi:hypothetical protein Sjap_023640 [Stephania japonica]|uniref:Uncharacterized protein n=1 Tax=Stephania japonica TaxID=461633 RepID=A0AAP0HJ58_9MAGN